MRSSKAEVARRNLRRFVVLDLLLGRVDQHHPLYSWLTSYGLSELDIEWFRQNPQTPDVLGIDYYPHSDWQLDAHVGGVRQRRADNPDRPVRRRQAYWQRYGIPMMLTETSIEGQPINREIWLETCVDHIKRLREEGVPMLGLIWWPMIDQLDWDGALTHRIGKIHEVGLFNLKRTPDGTLARHATPLVKMFNQFAESRRRIGRQARAHQLSILRSEEEQLPPVGEWIQPTIEAREQRKSETVIRRTATALLPKRQSTIVLPISTTTTEIDEAHGLQSVDISTDDKFTESLRHRRLLSSALGIRLAAPAAISLAICQEASDPVRRRAVLRSARRAREPDLQFHRVMPNVTVMCPHVGPEWNHNPDLPAKLREWTAEAIRRMNENTEGAFDRPLLWYYSPMDSAWSLGHFDNRGVVYDCMDELSQFTGAPPQLIENEKRLMQHADVIFTGGYEMGEKRKKLHDNVHIFGCGVEFEHFGKARDPQTTIPAGHRFHGPPDPRLVRRGR